MSAGLCARPARRLTPRWRAQQPTLFVLQAAAAGVLSLTSHAASRLLRIWRPMNPLGKMHIKVFIPSCTLREHHSDIASQTA
jgi:hypothetical protein